MVITVQYPMNVCGIITICTISRKPFRKKELREDRIYGLKLIGKNEVFINNLNLKLRTLDAKSMRDDKEILKTMHEVFCGTYGTDCVDDIDAGNEDMFYLPAVIKSRETNALCVGLVLVDIESSGEHWGTQFMLDGNFYCDDSECMTDKVKTKREEIGVYDYWYTPEFDGDIHIDKENAPEDVRELLDYASGPDEADTRNRYGRYVRREK